MNLLKKEWPNIKSPLRPSKNKANWKRMLLHIYNNQHSWGFFTEEIFYKNKDNPIIKELNISFTDFQASFDFLQENSLISRDKKLGSGSPKKMLLTKRGLDVCLALEKHEDEEKRSRIITFLTLGLVLVSLVEAWLLIKMHDSLFLKIVVILIAFYLAILILRE